MLTQTILCSLTTGKPDEPIYCRYGEKGRQIKFELINPITDFTGYDATFYLFKPDGNFVVESLTIDNAGEYATLTLDENMTSASGRGVWDIKLSKTNVVIYTFSGEILIDKPTVTDEVIESVSVIHGHVFPDDYQLKLIAGEGIRIDQQTNVISVVGGGGGTTNYNDLSHKPTINNVTLSGNKTTEDLIPIGAGLEFDEDGKLTAPTPTISYTNLNNKPSINNVTLSGNKTTEDLIPIGAGLEFDAIGRLKVIPQTPNYSTDEQATGQTWIDGRTIYQKTLEFTNLVIGSGIGFYHHIDDLREMVKLEIAGYMPTQTDYACGAIVGLQSAYINSGGFMTVNTNSSWDASSARTWYFTIYYTKED